MKKFAIPLAAPLALGVALGVSTAPAMAKSTIGGTNDIDNFTLANAGNSRLRIKWNNEDRVSMYYEFAIGSVNKVRHAYGKWDFSETGQILAGATSTPFAPLNANVAMVHNSGQGYGRVSPGRPSQMRYTYKFLNRDGAIAVALVDPNKGKSTTALDANGDETAAGSREQSFPRVDIGMAYSTFNWQIFPSAFYHQVDFAGTVDSLTASGIALGFKTGTGPITFTAELGAGSNWGNTAGSYSGSTAGDRAFALYDNGGTKANDNDNTGFFVDVGYRFTGDETRGTVHFIYGAMTSEATSATRNIDATSTMIGLSVPIDLPYIARGFRIRPELFLFEDEDKGDAAVDRSNLIAGVQLQYTF